ncbi:hypothetical protein IAR55_001929 [Kwoniella newhampshirensis]|uniref:Selenoprotein O n=1 Tax=Kwoniella newhampshirensis TaxID=1651941 RepID=A0AAW0Z3H2_9TREE
MSSSLPIHRLPLPSATLQTFLPRLPLSDQPSSQRRSTTFKPSSEGVWARVNPLWAPWPLRLTKEEVLEMGVDVDQGEQVNVEDVLRRWDPVEVQDNDGQENGNGLKVMSSAHRLKCEPILLGVSPSALEDSLPHLNVGDAVSVCNRGDEPANTETTDGEAREIFTDILSGRKVLSSDDSTYGPWSTRYCGHQFGVWAGQLGDGRAISILETESEKAGRQEIQLKGAGRTPFSRTADGLAVLRSGVREFLGCEAVAALGIPTTRSLALLTTPFPNLPVARENGPEPTSLLCRLAPSFIRIGHFEALNPGKDARNMRQFYMGGRGWLDDQSEGENEEGNLEGLRSLAEWVKGDIMGMKEATYQDWVEEVIKKNAEMIAKWQVHGYMNGVINTDNVTLIGATIDYGPYAFMDVYDENHICNHSDPSGLYSYRNQPSRILFALDKLVSALAPVIGYDAIHSSVPAGYSNGASKAEITKWEKKAAEIMQGWERRFGEIQKDGERKGWLKRFGLKTEQRSDSRDIIYDYLSLLHAHSLDFHTSFRQLSSFNPTRAYEPTYIAEFTSNFVRSCSTSLPSDASEAAERAISSWLKVYAARIQLEEEVSAWNEAGSNREKEMKSVNPRFVLRQWVLEEVIEKMEKSLMGAYTSIEAKEEVDEKKVQEGIKDARKYLAKILDMSTRPFEPWGECESSSESIEEEARLCGLGKKEMLGFQCSCSS